MACQWTYPNNLQNSASLAAISCHQEAWNSSLKTAHVKKKRECRQTTLLPCRCPVNIVLHCLLRVALNESLRLLHPSVRLSIPVYKAKGDDPGRCKEPHSLQMLPFRKQCVCSHVCMCASGLKQDICKPLPK